MLFGGRREERARVAQELGLEVDGHVIQGTRAGVPVHIKPITEGSGDNRSSYTEVRAEFVVPLRLGLTIVRTLRLGAALRGVFGMNDGEENAAVDERFSVKSDFNADALIGDATVRHALLRAEAFHSRLRVSDRGARFRFPGHGLARLPLADALTHLAELVKVIANARWELPREPYEDAVSKAMKHVAHGNGLTVEERSLTLAGSVRTCECRVWVDYRLGKFETVFRARFRRPLNAKLVLAREHFGASFLKLFGYQDIVIGDKAFDDIFLVKGEPKDAVRALLAPPLTSAMVEIAQGSKHLKLDASGVLAHVGSLMTDEVALERSLNKIASVAATLSDRSRPSGSGYR